MSAPDLNQSPSEQSTLKARGYKLVKKLGEGSYAKVYLAEYMSGDDRNQERSQLACKIIDTVKAPRDFVRKFLPRELDILVRLNHPHIVHVHSIFQRRSKYFIFMRFAENGDLLDFVLKNGAVAESQARVWLRQLALAMQYLHELEIAHRDLKCENILITTNFNIKLADFGFARSVVDNKGKRVMSDTYCGSLSYAAPEILRGTPYNPKIADIWSMGVVLYIMLNKAMPFDDTNIKKLYQQQTNKRWKFRAKVIDILTDQVKHLVTNMLEPDVTKRFRLEQILGSDWVAMDTRLLILTPGEQYSLQQAKDDRKRRLAAAMNPSKDNQQIGAKRKGVGGTDGIMPEVELAAQAVAAGTEAVTVIKEVPAHPISTMSESVQIGNAPASAREKEKLLEKIKAAGAVREE